MFLNNDIFYDVFYIENIVFFVLRIVQGLLIHLCFPFSPYSNHKQIKTNEFKIFMLTVKPLKQT